MSVPSPVRSLYADILCVQLFVKCNPYTGGHWLPVARPVACWAFLANVAGMFMRYSKPVEIIGSTIIGSFKVKTFCFVPNYLLVLAFNSKQTGLGAP